MEKLKFNVKGMGIKLFDRPDVLTYNKNEVLAEFIFTGEWIGPKTAIFDVDENSYTMLIDENNQCAIPEECYFATNRKFKVGVVCGDLITTNEATVQVDKSCYEPDTTVPNLTPDAFTQLRNEIDTVDKKVDEVSAKIEDLEVGAVDLSDYMTAQETEDKINEIVDEKIGNLEVGSTDLTNYYTKEQIDYMSGLSEFFTHVNGSATTWIPGIQGFSVPALNTRLDIPAMFSDLVSNDNTNDASHYAEIIAGGVKLSDDISEKCKRITFSGSVKMFEGQYCNSECRLIAHAPDCPESIYRGETHNFNRDLCIELGTYGPPMGGKRSGDFSPRPFNTVLKNKTTGEIVKRDGWILRWTLMTDSYQEIIVNSSFILMTFWNRKIKEELTEV